MQPLTNDLRRARVKLTLLERDHISWLVEDIIKELAPTGNPYTTKEIIRSLKNKYKKVISQAPGELQQLSMYKEE